MVTGILSGTDLSPTSVKRCVEDAGGLFVLEHPLAVNSNVFLIVDSRPPHCPVSVSYCARHEQVPACPGRVPGDFDLGVQAVVDRESEYLGRSPEEFPDRISSLEPSERATLPYRVLNEQGRYPIGVVACLLYTSPSPRD